LTVRATEGHPHHAHGPRGLAEQLRTGARAIALVPGRNSTEAKRLAPEVRRYLEQRNLRVADEPEASEDLGLVVSLGGDGLMMRAARKYPDLPILGINFGHFGFLTAAEASEWSSALERVLEGAFLLRVDPTLATKTIRADGTHEDIGWAVNDVVVDGGFHYIRPTLYIDDQYVNEYPGDGMVISTPGGSTAYCMAAGGPVLLSGVDGFAIVPLNCHSPIRVSLVVPEDMRLTIKLAGRGNASLILDGQSDDPPQVGPGDAVEVRRGPVAFRHVSFRSFDWFAAFQSKFNYQIRPPPP
jgi:NAD+ kinase